MPVSYRVCCLPACLLEKYCAAVCVAVVRVLTIHGWWVWNICFCSKLWCGGNHYVLPKLDIWLLMTTESVTEFMFSRAYKCAVFLPFNSDRCRSALGRSTHLHCFLKKEFSTLTSFLFNTHTHTYKIIISYVSPFLCTCTVWPYASIPWYKGKANLP